MTGPPATSTPDAQDSRRLPSGRVLLLLVACVLGACAVLYAATSRSGGGSGAASADGGGALARPGNGLVGAPSLHSVCSHRWSRVPSGPTKGARILYLAGDGSDDGPGTAKRPWRTIARAEAAVAPGDTVCIGPGRYGKEHPRHRTVIQTDGTASRPISWLRSPGGPLPVVRGSTKIEGAYNRFSGLLFNGPSGPIDEKGGQEDVLVWVNADHVRIDHSVVRGSAGHAGIFISEASGYLIDHDYVHDNGVEENLDHGIYVSSANSAGRIEDNLIADNYAWGIHLYPDAKGVVINQNTVVDNGRGGIIVANSSADNLMTNNVVADNAEYGIRGYELTGSGNRATNNLVWGQDEDTAGGIEFSDTIVADPRFVGPADFHLRSGSPAIEAATGGQGGSDIEGRRRGSPGSLGAFEASP